MKTRALILTGVEHVEMVEQEVAAPQPWEILVNTKINGICAFELHSFSGELPFDRFPMGMGHEAVGIVADVGTDVTRFKVGDKVTTLGYANYSDYYLVREEEAEKIPDDEQNLAHWISEPPACAVNGIRQIEARDPGSKTTIIGCGFMGLLLIQLGVKRGMDVIARDLNPERLELAQKYGARVETPDPGSQDVVIECSGAAEGITESEHLLRHGGILCLFAHHLPTRVCNTNLWHMNSLDVLNATPSGSRDWNRDFHEAVQYIRDGVFDQRPLVTHSYAAAEAQTVMESLIHRRPKDYIKGVFRF